jgi:glycosyltransferase involved in cell wall biosynthesis
VPDTPETVHEHGQPLFEVVDYETATTVGVTFREQGSPDIINAWSPREHVRNCTAAMVERYGCPYTVHMEDNEEAILLNELKNISLQELSVLPRDLSLRLIGPYRSHPVAYKRFIAEADGYSCLIDKLLEFSQGNENTLVVWPGFDDPFSEPMHNRSDVRKRHGLQETDIAILYSGNVHASVVDDVRALYAAIGLLRRRGYPIKLFRTGMNYADLVLDKAAEITAFLTELGFVPRAEVPDLVRMCDLLVQPGKPDAFNEYRFPSKIPEYLASGRPVILPRSNIGRALRHNVDALLLESGSIKEIASSIEVLIKDKTLGSAIGANGRDFALQNLNWPTAAQMLEAFYSKIWTEHENKISVAPKQVVKSEPTSYPAKLVAFYLPQFHPIAENDRWWGKGFTEWTNVSRATPNFGGHQHPRIPGELGYYDLRVPEVMHAQVELAREYGVGGFCFYYYWFSGKRLLEKPLDYWLSPAGPDFPFCICWANESWSRRWDGSESEVIMSQTYEEGSDSQFFMDILPILKDPRYIRVDNAPVLLLYRVTDLKDSIGTAKTWRRLARENGIDKLHLVVVQSFGISDPRPYGFDAAVEFSPPHTDRMLVDPAGVGAVNENFEGYLEDYISVAMRSINHDPTDYIRYRGLFPRWDNTARRKSKGHVFINESPYAYAQWLRYLIHESLMRRDQQEPLIFVNAWNEWAEGAYLEPDEMYGRGLLEVTRAALNEGVADWVGAASSSSEGEFANRVAILPKLTALK